MDISNGNISGYLGGGSTNRVPRPNQNMPWSEKKKLVVNNFSTMELCTAVGLTALYTVLAFKNDSTPALAWDSLRAKL